MYKVEFQILLRLEIETDDVSKSILLNKNLVLPFVPTKEITYSDGGWDCDSVEKVYWDNQDQMFFCIAAPEHIDSVEELADYLERGWIYNEKTDA